MTSNQLTTSGEYDCAYCPLGGIGEPVMLDGFPAHPDCAAGADGSNLSAIRSVVTLRGIERTEQNVLVVDDFRTLSFPATTVRRRETAEVALYSQPWDEVWLDHDLEFALTEAEFHAVHEYNIRPLIEKIVADAKAGKLLPVGLFLIHSSNIGGRVYMQDKLSPFYPVKMVNAYDWTAKHSFPSWTHKFGWGDDGN